MEITKKFPAQRTMGGDLTAYQLMFSYSFRLMLTLVKEERRDRFEGKEMKRYRYRSSRVFCFTFLCVFKGVRGFGVEAIEMNSV